MNENPYDRASGLDNLGHPPGSLSRSDQYLSLFIGYMVLLHLLLFCGLVLPLPGGKPAYIVDAATLFPAFLMLCYWHSSTSTARITTLDFAVIIYMTISVLSGFLFFQPGNPSSPTAYFYGLHYFVLPMFLYFAVKAFNSSRQYKLLRWVCYLNIFAVVIGIILFFWRPDFYYIKIASELVGPDEVFEDWQVFGRMQSYMGSTALGSIITATIILTVLLRLPNNWVMFVLPTMFLGSILTFQRAGFVTTAIATIYALTKLHHAFSIKLKLIMPVVCLVLLTVGIAYHSRLDENSLVRIMDKYSLGSLQESLDLQKRGYVPGLAYIKDFPMGVGLGATSSVADTMGLAGRGQVVDANFMRILADLGILGLISFLAVLIAAARSALKRENGFGWLLLFGLTILICVGTNTLDSYYVSHSFWLFLGVIDTRDTRSGHDEGDE
jgi:hypothetical protein